MYAILSCYDRVVNPSDLIFDSNTPNWRAKFIDLRGDGSTVSDYIRVGNICGMCSIMIYIQYIHIYNLYIYI